VIIPEEPLDPLAHYWKSIGTLSLAISRSRAVNVNSEELRNQARTAVQQWFRETRPYILGIGIAEQEILSVDDYNQRLLSLAAARNKKSSYINALRPLLKHRSLIDSRVHLLLGSLNQRKVTAGHSSIESRILATLQRMLPHSALSYHQALLDLADNKRSSYRGTATELREVVREVLDHLAPDEEVMKSVGFRLEKDRKGPTMKQKARFILKARGMGETARKAPEDAVGLLEDQIASLARSTYERGSASTHSATRIETVRYFKGYADAVLAELLQVHQ
jgi:hypothetical protein